jgi:hypothetical protein
MNSIENLPVALEINLSEGERNNQKAILITTQLFYALYVKGAKKSKVE